MASKKVISSTKTDSTRCVNCKVILRCKSGQKGFIRNEGEAPVISCIFNKTVNVGDVICSKCRMILFMKNRANHLQRGVDEFPHCSQLSSLSSSSMSSSCSKQDPTFSVNLQQDNVIIKLDRYIELPFKRVLSTHKYCFLCGSTVNKIVTVPFEVSLHVFARRRVFIPNGNRCCPSHLLKQRFFEEDLNRLSIYSNSSTLDIEEVEKFLEQMLIHMNASIFNKIGDFSLSEEKLKTFTGLL